MAVKMDDARRISQVPRPKGWIQRRYVLAVMGSICIMMMFILKVNFSVGLVAMVKPVSQHNTSNGTLHQGNEGEEGEFDWDIETQGNILAAYFYGYVATQMLGGYLASRWGGKVVVGPGIALTGFFTLFTPVAARQGGPWALFAVRVLQGLCSVDCLSLGRGWCGAPVRVSNRQFKGSPIEGRGAPRKGREKVQLVPRRENW